MCKTFSLKGTISFLNIRQTNQWSGLAEKCLFALLLQCLLFIIHLCSSVVLGTSLPLALSFFCLLVLVREESKGIFCFSCSSSILGRATLPGFREYTMFPPHANSSAETGIRGYKVCCPAFSSSWFFPPSGQRCSIWSLCSKFANDHQLEIDDLKVDHPLSVTVRFFISSCWFTFGI